MKHPFNIEQAKAGAKVTTKFGNPIKILDFNLNSPYPILGLITHSNGTEGAYQFGPDGEDRYGGKVAFIDDGIPVKVKYFVNIWRDQYYDGKHGFTMYKTQEEAVQNSNNEPGVTVVVAKPLEWDE